MPHQDITVALEQVKDIEDLPTAIVEELPLQEAVIIQGERQHPEHLRIVEVPPVVAEATEVLEAALEVEEAIEVLAEAQGVREVLEVPVDDQEVLEALEVQVGAVDLPVVVLEAVEVAEEEARPSIFNQRFYKKDN